MRTYAHNSPEAAGRVLALVLMVDGHVCRREFDALEHLDANRELGLPPRALPQLLQELCDDMLDGLCTTGSMQACLDDRTLGALLGEIDDPALQRKVLRQCEAAAAADRHLAESETFMLEALRRHWPKAAHSEPAPLAS